MWLGGKGDAEQDAACLNNAVRPACPIAPYIYLHRHRTLMERQPYDTKAIAF